MSQEARNEMSPRKTFIKKTPLKISVSKRLEILRNQLGLKPSTMAGRLKVTAETYRAYGNGEPIPSTTNLATLAPTTNASLDWLITGKGE
ncbi:MAG: helix-turn-helix transcriptional regulator, partial [bacterium]|nr:helix-turn-helix transcriptional regulator [bacterium]